MIEYNLSLEGYVNHIKNGIFRPKRAHELLYHAVQYAINHNEVPNDVDLKLLHKIIDQYLCPASAGYDIQKRILILVGPPGSGKSSMVRFLKQALEKYSLMDEGAIYKISGCPMQEDPLLALPEDDRNHLPIQVKGTLSPLNQHRLEHEWKDWRHIPVERFYISEAERKGIGTFFPTDPYSQDTSDLIGSIDYANITKYGSPSDPRAYRYDGEFQAANRGLLELQEVFKSEPELLYPFLSLAEENQYKISRQSLISADEVIIGHTNEPDLIKVVQREQSPLLNRMVFIKVSYNLSVEQEANIYKQKIFEKDKERLSFRALEALAAALIFTRMKRPRDGLTKIEKLQQYNNSNQRVEAMTGLDPRYAFQVLSVVCAKNLNIIEANDLLDELKRIIQQDYRILDKQKETYLYNIQLANKYYDHEWMKLIRTIIEEVETDQLNQFINTSSSKQVLHKAIGVDESNYEEFQSISQNLSLDVVELTYHDLTPEAKDSVIDLFILSKKGELDDWLYGTLIPAIELEGIVINEGLHEHLIRVIEKYLASNF